MMPIEQIIQRIAVKDYRGPRAGQFLYDPAHKAIIDRVPILGSGRIRAFQVVTSLGGVTRAEGPLPPVLVQDPETGSWATVHIDYQAWVTPNNAPDLVRACADDAPGKRLVGWVIGIVQQVVGRDPSVLDEPGAERLIAAEREIEQSLLRQCGLTAIIRLRLDGEEATPAPDIQMDVHARVADYPYPVKLHATVLTEVRARERGRVFEAMRRKPAPDLKAMTAWACHAALENLSVAQIRIGLHGEVARQVRIALEPALATCFIRVRQLRLELREELRSPPEEFDGDVRVDLAMRGCPTSVPLRVSLHLQLRDEAAYWRAREPALAGWVNSVGRDAVVRCLDGIRYSQLCLRTSEWEERMMHGLRVAAGSIGYVVTARLDAPGLPEVRFLTPFVLEVAGEFTCADSDVRTQMTVALQLKLDAIDSVAQALDARANLEAEFRQAVLDEVTAYVHTLQAGQLYAHFHVRAPITAPLGAERSSVHPTVESILHERVEHSLRRRFGLRLLSFTAKLGASEIQAVCAALLATPAIEFEVEVLISDQVAPVVHHGTLQVESIRPADWAQFYLRRPTVDDVRRTAERVMRSLLQEAMPDPRFGLASARARALAYDELPIKIRDALGVTVKCLTWNRVRSEDDVKITEAKREYRDRLYRRQVTDYDEWEDEVAQLKVSAKKLRLKGDHDGARRKEQELDELRRRKPGDPYSHAALPLGGQGHDDREDVK